MSDENPNQKPTLLIVDDASENLAVLIDLLMPVYRIRVANSGQRALDVANTLPKPDLILLDVMMPEMDGYQVLTHLRQNPKTADIPVIFVTAMESSDDEALGLDLGAADYLTKPIRPAIVLSRIRSQLELKNTREQLLAQNSKLEAEVELRAKQLQTVRDISIRALASIAETRDNETGKHIIRTQAYVRVLCDHLIEQGIYADELTSKKSDIITKAAPLHDIGKVGIPDHILLKPGRLNDEELVIMRTHAKIGADALWRAIQTEEDHSGLGFLFVAMDIAHYHHEKWDGSGYPEGLKEYNIPLPARLMALADVYDALINRRVYKKEFSLEQTLAIIKDGRGSHFDPQIVDAFFVRQTEFQEIAERYAETLH
ncbi:MAG: response regulator [Methylovulum sp.]|jgi:putative two-component system response regulator|nr:response regulator [Methylovulum sp.]MCF7998169.1 response regulator [Methylovulum sp.]